MRDSREHGTMPDWAIETPWMTKHEGGLQLVDPTLSRN